MGSLFSKLTIQDVLDLIKVSGESAHYKSEVTTRPEPKYTKVTSFDQPIRFELRRTVDVSGISGVGAVAYGVVFADDTAVIRWNTDTASTGIYASVEELLAIHGHEGSTEVFWID